MTSFSPPIQLITPPSYLEAVDLHRVEAWVIPGYDPGTQAFWTITRTVTDYGDIENEERIIRVDRCLPGASDWQTVWSKEYSSQRGALVCWNLANELVEEDAPDQFSAGSAEILEARQTMDRIRVSPLTFLINLATELAL